MQNKLKGLIICCISLIGLYCIVLPQDTTAQTVNPGNQAIQGHYYIKFPSVAERNNFENAARGVLPITLPNSNNSFKRAGYAMLRVQNVANTGSLIDFMNQNRIHYSYIVPVIAHNMLAYMNYNDSFYQQNKQPELDQYGTIGFCPNMTSAGYIAIVDGVFQTDHVDLNFDEVYDAADDDGDVSPVNRDPVLVMLGGDHGSAVASIADGVTNNISGMASVSEGILHLIGIKAQADAYRTTGTVKLITHGIEGLMEAYSRYAYVINLSFGKDLGGSCLPERQDAINFVTNNFTIVVAAAGNDGSNYLVSPASCANVISVGSVSPGGNLSSFSNHGALLCAPGESIFAVRPLDTWKQNYQGTSMSSPFVAAALAAGLDPFLWTRPSNDGQCQYMMDLKLCKCGDNITQTREQCDDGNHTNNDGCDQYCRIE